MFSAEKSRAKFLNCHFNMAAKSSDPLRMRVDFTEREQLMVDLSDISAIGML